MNYELCKALKEAGYRQHDHSDDDREVIPCFEHCCVPTLSELIEACGKDFMLTNECGTWEAWSGSNCEAVRLGEGGAKFECEGDTPNEAVARLWLALNKPVIQ